MDAVDTSIPALSRLIEERLALVSTLAESLESSTVSLVRNDAQAIARGAAHQAELCRQWSCLEDKLRREARTRIEASSEEAERSARLQAEWKALAARVQHLTRVHWSLLRHLQRSLAVLERVVDSCATTYGPGLGLPVSEPRFAGEGITLQAGD